MVALSAGQSRILEPVERDDGIRWLLYHRLRPGVGRPCCRPSAKLRCNMASADSRCENRGRLLCANRMGVRGMRDATEDTKKAVETIARRREYCVRARREADARPGAGLGWNRARLHASPVWTGRAQRGSRVMRSEYTRSLQRLLGDDEICPPASRPAHPTLPQWC